MKKSLLLASAGILLGGMTVAQAQVTLLVSADTYLVNDFDADASLAHGTDTSMEIRSLRDRRMHILYFRFDLSGVTGDLSDATISLNATSSKKNGTVQFHGILDGALGGQGENWDESTLVYNNAAGFSPTYPGQYVATSDLSAILATVDMSDGAPGLYSTTATTTMDDFLAADTNGMVTFAALYTGPNGNARYVFSTKEADAALSAQLNLPYATAVPEPATVAFFLGGFSLLLVLYRRRSR